MVDRLIEQTTESIPYLTSYDLYFSKRDLAGAELPGAELSIESAYGTVDSWVSDGSYHLVTGLQADVVYTFTETSAPDGYLVAESIDFVMENSRIYVYVNEGGIVRKKEVTDLLVVMVDQYAPVTTTETEETTTTETETTTTVTETVTETDETTTTTKQNVGSDTLTSTTTTTTETTTTTTETETETTTTDTETETTTTTTTDISTTTSRSGSSTKPTTTTSKTTTTKRNSSSGGGSSSDGSTGTTPKTGDRALPIFITGGAAFLLAAASKPKRKNKKV